MLILLGIIIFFAGIATPSGIEIAIGIVLFLVGVSKSYKPDPVKEKEERNRKQEEKLKAVRNEYDYDRFATILRKNLTEEEFRYSNKGFSFLDSPNCKTGVRLFLDRVETYKQVFYYSDYNVDYDKDKLNDLAIYLEGVADQYVTTEKELIHKTEMISSFTTMGETHYFETPGGHLSSYDTGGTIETFEGYRVYITGKKVKDTSLKEW